MSAGFQWLVKAGLVAIARPKLNRVKDNVLGEYSAGWETYRGYLAGCASIDDWLRVKGMEDLPQRYNIAGKACFKEFDSNDYNRQKILQALLREFPNAKSVTEYGCGLGRNLLFLKRHMPQLDCFGYELCAPGVEIAKSAAAKFGIQVNYSQLDYVGAPDTDYVFPATDVAFTLFSLEQLPHTNRQAMLNILKRTKMGSIHIEPVPENYPMTIRGLIGKLDHWKVDYLKNFEKNIASLELAEIKREYLDTAHNPLMFPTMYVTKKS